MGLNITHTMNSFQFESRENLRKSAKNILNRQGATNSSMQNILQQTIFDEYRSPINSQLAVLKASSQISANTKLKETLKYLKNQAHKKTVKEPILGELWNLVNSGEEDQNYTGELSDFVIDASLENIFAAA